MNGTDTNSMVSMLLPLILIFGAMYFFLVRPQKKKEKADQQMRSSVEVGDEITTIGGLIGRVISVKEDDDTIVFETSNDKTKIKLRKWAIRSRDVITEEE